MNHLPSFPPSIQKTYMGNNLHLLKKHDIKENIVYLALWLILFLAPVLAAYLRGVSDSHATFQWSEIFMVWRTYAFFLIVFLIHNFLLAPWLVYARRKTLYFSSVVALLGAFMIYQCTSHRPMEPMPGGPPEMGDMHRPPEAFNDDSLGNAPMPPDFDSFDERNEERGEFKGPRGENKRFKDFDTPPDHQPPLFFGQHDIVMLVVLVLMLGMNLGVKLYFKSRSDAEKMDELASKNLEQQLEYLKYQINPHFFMNTLNNIHALVDINPEKAKETILELSKLMRYVLYEGAKASVPLQREVDFLNNYITLMRIRYTDRVKITMNVPESLPDKSVPPLLFITFVENAFKHGISYRKDSFIDVSMLIEGDRVKFVCRNSKVNEDNDTQGGVGLANVKQRLDLIYGEDYALDITDETEVYDVRLSIPLL